MCRWDCPSSLIHHSHHLIMGGKSWLGWNMWVGLPYWGWRAAYALYVGAWCPKFMWMPLEGFGGLFWGLWFFWWFFWGSGAQLWRRRPNLENLANGLWIVFWAQGLSDFWLWRSFWATESWVSWLWEPLMAFLSYWAECQNVSGSLVLKSLSLKNSRM